MLFTSQYSTSAEKGLLIKTHKKEQGNLAYFDNGAN